MKKSFCECYSFIARPSRTEIYNRRRRKWGEGRGGEGAADLL